MEKLRILIKSLYKIQVIHSIIIVLISFVLYKIIANLLNENDERKTSKLLNSKKGKTYLRLIKNIIRYVFIIVTILILLQINGINVNSMLAGVGIISVIIGFAVQDALKDIIKGFDIISDSYYQVGDIIKFKEIEGKVLGIGLKTTKMQDLVTGNIISIANRNIEQVEVVSNLVYISIPFSKDIPVKKAENIIQIIINIIALNNNVNECKYKGVSELGESDIKYLIEINCNPNYKFQVKRDALRDILIELEKKKIKIPHHQVDFHEI